jgi:NMT1 family protein
MRRRSRLAPIVSALVLVAAPVWADSLSERRAAKEKADVVEVEVACGKLDKENCAVVVPEINGKTVSQNVRLKPLESKGSVESVNGLCDGDVQMAVVQADVLAVRSAKPDCAGKLVALGKPLYPYEGFMVVRAETGEARFGDMIARLAPGAVLRVAAGGSGSGGELTLRNILASAPEWKQVIDIAPDGADTALNKLRDRQIDAFFVMDGPQSPLLQDVRETVDPKTKQTGSSVSVSVNPRPPATSVHRLSSFTPCGGRPPVSMKRATIALRFSGFQRYMVRKIKLPSFADRARSSSSFVSIVRFGPRHIDLGQLRRLSQLAHLANNFGWRAAMLSEGAR